MCVGRQLLGISHDPEKHTGIEQNIHSVSPVKAARNSAGKGSKNSDGNSVPQSAANPKGRGRVRGLGSGRISAMGMLRLHNRMVSPCSRAGR